MFFTAKDEQISMLISTYAGVTVGAGDGEEHLLWDVGYATENLVVDGRTLGARDEKTSGADLFVDGVALVEGDEVSGGEATFSEGEGDSIGGE